MSNLIYDHSIHSPMDVAVFLSGTGTNFRELYREQKRLEKLGHTHYGRIAVVVSDNRNAPGLEIAKSFGIPTKVIDTNEFNQERGIRRLSDLELDHPARVEFDTLSVQLMEQVCQPHLVCLAGYNRWLSPHFIGRYGNRTFNVHPADTTKGYVGSQEVPIAKAILAGDVYTRSTIFFVDESKDIGPVLVQSRAIRFADEAEIESIQKYAQRNGIHNMQEFRKVAREDIMTRNYLNALLEIAKEHQEKMKIEGDWPSYKFAVHHLVAQGRVAIDGKDVYVDGNKLPQYGFRLDEHREEFERSGITI